ncbi:hypothetical protein D8Y31_24835, partial [Escherichia coli]|uniref:hypothetical protein n=1 Tax=Escherichia coli TaxID=562 RepID=UPI000F10ED58
FDAACYHDHLKHFAGQAKVAVVAMIIKTDVLNLILGFDAACYHDHLKHFAGQAKVAVVAMIIKTDVLNL